MKTVQITIQRMTRRKRDSWPLTGTGTGILLALLVVGAGLVGLAFVGH